MGYYSHAHTISNKVGEVTSLLCNNSWQKAMEETKKCDVVCVNCHKIRTARRFKWAKAN